MRCAILGCGPAGLLAAHACKMNYVDFDIFSKARKSHLFGSQYLHEPIPGLTEEGDMGVPVKYIVEGTPEQYRRKTHGKWWGGRIDPEEFQTDHTAWNIRQHYDLLWNMYGGLVDDYEIPTDYGPTAGNSIHRRVSMELSLDRYDLVISTVPRTIWAIEGEEYIYSEGWALGDAPERGQVVEDMVPEVRGEWGYIGDNQIVCDGTDTVSWTRLSRVFGYTTVEWPHHAPQPHPSAVMVRKPLGYTPAPGKINPTSEWLHVGRYGKFERGIVVSDAFRDVVKRIQEMK